jgi:hypothetical protein
VATAAAAPAQSGARTLYPSRGPDPLCKLFLQRFPTFLAAHEQRYAAFFGKFRLPLICRAASAFRCTSCAQKRTLLLGEYLGDDLLLCLPHRQAVQWPALGFVWTIPRVLRVFLRHDRELFADIGRRLFDILTRYFTQAAGSSIYTAMVSSHQTFGEFAAWHPHWHAIVLEGGFDRHDRFFFIPLGVNEALTEIWRHRVVALFLSKGLLNPDFARKLLSWRHSGFSIESGTRTYDQEARQALSQYIVRAPLSREKIHWDQDQDTVSWKSSTSGYFKDRERHFSCLDFIAQVTLHIPPRGRHLVRRYGLYSSRGRGIWKNRPALCTRAPQHWYGRQAAQPPTPTDAPKDQEVSTLCSNKAWARLLAKVYELDVMACPNCGCRMSVIAVILDPAEIRSPAGRRSQDSLLRMARLCSPIRSCRERP